MATKLTAVTLTFRTTKLQTFMELPLNEKNQPFLSESMLASLLDELDVHSGATYSIG